MFFLSFLLNWDWKKAKGMEKNIVGPIHKGGHRSVVKNYRPFSLTSVVFKLMEHAKAGFIRQVWEDGDWLYEVQHGFRMVSIASEPDTRARVK